MSASGLHLGGRVSSHFLSPFIITYSNAQQPSAQALWVEVGSLIYFFENIAPCGILARFRHLLPFREPICRDLQAQPRTSRRPFRTLQQWDSIPPFNILFPNLVILLGQPAGAFRL